MLPLIIFLIVLGTLVFIHELGHFLLAKKAGVKVEEFGFGYPPRALKIGEKWGTLFTLNWIPFGGFVKILGENYKEEKSPQETVSQKILGSPLQSSTKFLSKQFPAGSKNFTQISKKWQAAILAAGVTFNIIFAWLLFSLGFMIGLPTSVNNNFGGVVKNPILTITELAPNSPAQKIGLKTGDKIINIFNSNGDSIGNLNPENVSNFISNSANKFSIEIDRGGKILSFSPIPEAGLVADRKIIGIGMDMVGTLSLPLPKALYEGGKTTLKLSYFTVTGIGSLVTEAFRGKADFSQVAGPVGIIGLVGDAEQLGLAYLITFTALISINLAVINLVPFPALDGGRILFVAIEGITKKKINPKIASTLNTIGFFILIALMIIVTYRDILRLF
jgi:regulator of sigma E protease